MEKPEKLPVFQSLVATELEQTKGTAVWIDTKNQSSTYALSSQGGPRIMERVEIGRAFTPFQHHTLIQELDEFITCDTELLVLPQVDFLYIDGQVKEWEAEELFRETWEKILEVKREFGLKVLVSTSSRGETLGYVARGDADNKIEARPTGQGLKYNSNNYQQLLYREAGELQTTLPYWRRKTSGEVEVAVQQVQ